MKLPLDNSSKITIQQIPANILLFSGLQLREKKFCCFKVSLLISHTNREHMYPKFPDLNNKKDKRVLIVIFKLWKQFCAYKHL